MRGDPGQQYRPGYQGDPLERLTRLVRTWITARWYCLIGYRSSAYSQCMLAAHEPEHRPGALSRERFGQALEYLHVSTSAQQVNVIVVAGRLLPGWLPIKIVSNPRGPSS